MEVEGPKKAARAPNSKVFLKVPILCDLTWRTRLMASSGTYWTKLESRFEHWKDMMDAYIPIKNEHFQDEDNRTDSVNLPF